MSNDLHGNILVAAKWLATSSAEERGAAPAVDLLQQRFGISAFDAERAARHAWLIRARAH